MAYVSPSSRSSGDVITAAIWNQDVVDNSKASAPDVFTTKGDIFAATAADAGARLAVGANSSTLVPDSTQTTGLAWQIQPAARVYNNANLDPTPDTWWSCTFNSERFDTDAMHSTVSNTNRLTVPTNGGGLYTIGANVQIDTSATVDPTTIIGLQLILNGSTVIARVLTEIGDASDDHCLAVETLYALSAGDYVEAQVYVSDDINILNANNFSPEFWANWERRSS